ncbi:MAG: hypothetical protein R3A10_09335 [Caldilineaceae bacterium]
MGDGTAETTPCTQRRLAALRVSTAQARRNIYLRQVTPPPLVTDEQRRRARQPTCRSSRVSCTRTSTPICAADDVMRACTAAVFRRMLPLPGRVDAKRADDWLRALLSCWRSQFEDFIEECFDRRRFRQQRDLIW